MFKNTLGLEVVWLINVEPVGGYNGLCLLLWILSLGGGTYSLGIRL